MGALRERIEVSLDWDNRTIRVRLKALGDEFLYQSYGKYVRYRGKESRSGGYVSPGTYKELRQVAEQFARRWRALGRMRRPDPGVRDDAKAIMKWYREHVARFSEAFDRPSEEHVHEWYKMSPAHAKRHTRDNVRAIMREISRIANKKKALKEAKKRLRRKKQEAKEAKAAAIAYAQPKFL